ncbi:MAG TPA: DUF1232 domain-containing protein [Polyangiales bacterium]|nr:DUF1232 domain-containing protein [Polyangiales bacterium]
MDHKHQDFYQKLRVRVDTWLAEQGSQHRYAQLLLIAPDLFHLLCRLVADPRVPRAQKTKLVLAIAYFISPLDLVPEVVLGPVALLDDVALAAYALNSVINSGQGEVAKELWAGDGDVLALIQHIVQTADEMLGGGVWRRLRSMFN